ncbi:unnamed protein product [Symbiodinium natans]|uniref:Uncharacterized protein n=1 Tax=Symbiodinium natans TaxID=878477 RepID=A0A812MT99_9DINO|nr:unnamed protein product [Symbiodinium natans]
MGSGPHTPNLTPWAEEMKPYSIRFRCRGEAAAIASQGLTPSSAVAPRQGFGFAAALRQRQWGELPSCSPEALRHVQAFCNASGPGLGTGTLRCCMRVHLVSKDAST